MLINADELIADEPHWHGNAVKMNSSKNMHVLHCVVEK